MITGAGTQPSTHHHTSHVTHKTRRVATPTASPHGITRLLTGGLTRPPQGDAEGALTPFIICIAPHQRNLILRLPSALVAPLKAAGILNWPQDTLWHGIRSVTPVETVQSKERQRFIS